MVGDKVVLLGESKTGKTAWVHWIQNNKVKYRPTMGVETHKIKHKGKVMNIWDTAGKEDYRGLGDGYYIGAEVGVIFIDCTAKKLNYKIAQETWYRDFRRVAPDAQIIWAINKVDKVTDDGGLLARFKEHKKKYGQDVVLMSVKTGKGCEKLLDKLSKRVINVAKLYYVQDDGKLVKECCAIKYKTVQDIADQLINDYDVVFANRINKISKGDNVFGYQAKGKNKKKERKRAIKWATKNSNLFIGSLLKPTEYYDGKHHAYYLLVANDIKRAKTLLPSMFTK